MSERRAQSLTTAIVSGSFSGTISTLIFQPLDLLKTRIQIDKQERSQGLYKTFKEVLRREKFRGLWIGTIPSLYRTVPGVGIYYGCLHLMDRNLRGNPSHVGIFVSGATARSCAVLVLMPVNVIKIRFESGNFHYKTVPSAFKHIWSNEGIKGLYRGIFSTIIRDAPFSGAYLMFYSKIKTVTKQTLRREELNSLLVAFCGLLSGVLASLMTHPADVVKTKIQSTTEPYRNKTVILKIFKEDGFHGFVKGFVPRALRRTLISSMSWTVYEKIMSLVGIK